GRRGRVQPEGLPQSQVENETRPVLRPLAPQVATYGDVERRLLDAIAPERHARAVAVCLRARGRAEGIRGATLKKRQKRPEEKARKKAPHGRLLAGAPGGTSSPRKC